MKSFCLSMLALGMMMLAFTGTTTRGEEPATMPSGKGTITGTVTKDGQPAAKVNVRLLKAMSMAGGASNTPATQPTDAPSAPAEGKASKSGKMGPAVMTAVTDDKGMFTMSDVPEGDYDVAAGSKAMGRGRSTASVKAGETANVEISLMAGSGKK